MAVKSRLWTLVFYPESAPDNWEEILTVSGYKIAVSPCHNMDVDKNGEVKKAHYHAVVYNENPIGYNNVLRMTQRLNTVIPVTVHSKDGILDYLTHENEADKVHYSKDDIKYLNDFDPDIIPADVTQERDCLTECLQWIDYLKLTEYADFINVIKDDRELLDYAVKKVSFFANFLRSRRYTVDKTVELVENGDFIEII